MYIIKSIFLNYWLKWLKMVKVGAKEKFTFDEKTKTEIKMLASSFVFEYEYANYFRICSLTWVKAKKKYPEIQKIIDEEQVKIHLIVESSLIRAIKNGSVKAITYFLDRYYGKPTASIADVSIKDLNIEIKPVIMPINDIDASQYYSDFITGKLGKK